MAIDQLDNKVEIGGGAGSSGIDLNTDGSAEFDGAVALNGEMNVPGIIEPTKDAIAKLGSWNREAATVTGVDNVASVSGEHGYVQIGNKVLVAGQLNVTPSADATLTDVDIELPIPSNLGSSKDLNGAGVSVQGADASAVAGRIGGDNTNDNALLRFKSNGTNSHFIKYWFDYDVI